MLMLHTVIRSSIDRAPMGSPRYSMTWPCAPFAPTSASRARMMSLAVTPAGRLPVNSTAIASGRASGSVWVARMCSTSLLPTPNASAPNAPRVEVWLSPQTMVMPGWT